MPRIAITTTPFGATDRRALDLLDQARVDYATNPLGRRLKEGEVADVIRGCPLVIAGTEPITSRVLDAAPELRFICRLGIGLDSVDLLDARRRGIQVAYTPDGPSAAVAELTIGLMINAMRGAAVADRGFRKGAWLREFGIRIADATIGVIGVGRIGRRVIDHLLGGFPGVRILANDIDPKPDLFPRTAVEWTDKDRIYQDSDVVTLHVPLTPATHHLIGARELASMKQTAVLVNTARGAVVHEADLVSALSREVIRAAALDVFEEEPYQGELADLENAILTCHMGAMTHDARVRMEIEAAEECLRFIRDEPLRNPVPEEDYALAEAIPAA